LERFDLAVEELRNEKRQVMPLAKPTNPKVQWFTLVKWLGAGYLRPYLPLLFATFFCMALASLFNVGVLAFVKPVLEIIFLQEESERVQVESTTTIVENETQANPKDKMERMARRPLERFLQPMREFTHNLAKGHPFRMLCVVACSIVAVFFLKAFFMFAQDYLMKRISEGVIRRLRDDVYRHILELPLLAVLLFLLKNRK